MRHSGAAAKTVAVGVVLAMVLAACGAESESPPGTEIATTPTTAAPVSTSLLPGPTIGVTGVSFGGVLIDDNGRTMYVFKIDAAGMSSCYDECAAAWPPVAAGFVAGDRIDVMVGSTTRSDGSLQLTVNGQPVYLFSGDSQPGDINGQGRNDLWFVLGIDGEPITKTGTGGYGYDLPPP